MPNSHTTNMESWHALGWRIVPYSLPYATSEPPRPFRELRDAERTGPVVVTTTTQEDEPLFGEHIREATRAVRRLFE